jgi:dsRNA-specific ribonuclease
MQNPSSGLESQTTLASTTEAVIGAVYLDCERNMDVVGSVVRRMYSLESPSGAEDELKSLLEKEG